MYDIHTRTWKFGKICTIAQYPGYGYSISILPPPKLVRMRARVRIRVHVTGGVLARDLTCVGRLSEQPHWRWPTRCSGGQTRWTCELSGLCKVYHPKRWPAEGAVLFRPICGSIRPQLYSFGTRFYPSPCFGHIPARCTLFWPPCYKA